jgi:ABC-type multidrug transport system fused ATPase/permease subunit
MKTPFTCAAVLAGAVVLAGTPLSAQTTAATPDLLQTVTADSGPPALLRYNNRPITTLRASVVARSPHDRVDAIVRLLDRVLSASPPGTVTTRDMQGISVIVVGGRDTFAIFPQDVDVAGGETAAAKTAEAVKNLQLALDEAVELRTASALLRGAERAVVGTVLFVVLLFLVVRVHRRLAARLPTQAEEHLQRLSTGTATRIVVASRATHVLRLIVTAIAVVVALFLAYNWLTFVLRSFPYTRPWGESLRAFLTGRIELLALKFVNALPELFTALLVLVAARFVVRASNVLFEAAERGRVTLPGVYISLLARQRFRSVQGRQRLSGVDDFTRLEQRREPDDERADHHVFAVASRIRLRPDRRGRGDGDECGPAVDQDQDCALRGGHDPERRRGLAGHQELLAVP